MIGTAILGDDLAADAQAEFLDLVAEGVRPRGALRRMIKEWHLEDDPFEWRSLSLGLGLVPKEEQLRTSSDEDWSVVRLAALIQRETIGGAHVCPSRSLGRSGLSGCGESPVA